MAHPLMCCPTAVILRTISAFLLLLVSSIFVLGQSGPPQSDPQAIALAQQSIAALTNGMPVSDATLRGGVTWIAGSDYETGSAILEAKGTGQSRVDLALSNGTRTDIRNDVASAFPQGASIQNGGGQQIWAMHNCWIGASWFVPTLSLLSATSDPSLIFSYIGPKPFGATSVQQIRVYRYLSGQKQDFISLVQNVSTTDFYLDSTSLLPVAILFNIHPDDDANTDVPVEVDFSNYQFSNGVQVPSHIQKLVQGSVQIDLLVTSASINSGLADSIFSIQ